MTYCILFPDQLITAYSSYLTGQPTKENIQALTPVEMLLISKTDITSLSEKYPRWNLVLKTLAEQQYLELEKRIFQLQSNDALKRYSDLIAEQPELVQKVPLQYLASYLGITQRHLSRIRREMAF